MTLDKQPSPRFESEQEFLGSRLAHEQAPRLAVRVALDFTQAPANIAQKLREAAASVGQRMQAAFKAHIANISDEAQALATQLTFAEINKVPPTLQASMVYQGRDAPVVAEAAIRQRRIAPEVQAALVEHCQHHASAMQTLALRPDATLDTLDVLASSDDRRTRFNVAMNIGPRMKIDEHAQEDKKAAIFNALIAHYESDFAPYLVPVCQDSEQLREMYDKTSKALGMLSDFVDNPYTPDSVLVDIASSPTMQVVQHDAAMRAKEMLLVRADRREAESHSYDDMAPS